MEAEAQAQPQPQPDVAIAAEQTASVPATEVVPQLELETAPEPVPLREAEFSTSVVESKPKPEPEPAAEPQSQLQVEIESSPQPQTVQTPQATNSEVVVEPVVSLVVESTPTSAAEPAQAEALQEAAPAEEDQAEIDPSTLEELDLPSIKSDILKKAVPYCVLLVILMGGLMYVISYTYAANANYQQQITDNTASVSNTVCFKLQGGSQYCTNNSATTTASSTTTSSVNMSQLQSYAMLTLAFFYLSSLFTGFTLTFLIFVITLSLDKYEEQVKANDRIKRLKAAAPKMNLFDALFKNVKQEEQQAAAGSGTDAAEAIPTEVAADADTDANASDAVAAGGEPPKPASRVPSAHKPEPLPEAETDRQIAQRPPSARSNRSKAASRPTSAAHPAVQENITA